MKKIEVFEGPELLGSVPAVGLAATRCRLLGKASEIPLDDDLLSRHLLFLGGIGTGKTNAIFQLVSQLRHSLAPNDVMVVFDTKGDFHQKFYQAGDLVISNDQKATGSNGPDYWNIFRELSQQETLEEDVIEITRTLSFERTERSSQPFFPSAARDLLTAILIHFCRSVPSHDRHNAALRDFLNRSSSSELRGVLQQYDDLSAIVSYISEDRSPQTQGVISELQQMAREIFVGNFRQAGSLSIREAVRRKGGRAVFIEYDLGIGSMLTPIYRLLFDLAIKEALCREKSEGNVWFIIDEFRLLPHLQHVDDGVNFGRSLGAKFIIGVQNVDQVFHAYGEPLARSILSGFTSTVAFRVNDAPTREFIQGLFGKNRKRETFMSAIQSRGLVEQLREANVVEDWDVASLPVGKAVVGLPGYAPFLFEFRKY